MLISHQVLSKSLLFIKMEMCRACLSTGRNMIPFNETFINGYNLLTDLNIKPLDGMPQCACETCVNAVNNFIDFRDQCIQSESSLQKNLLKNLKLEPVDIEINHQEEDDLISSNDLYFERPRKERLPKTRLKKDKPVPKIPKKKRGRPKEVKTPLDAETVNPLFEFEVYSKPEEVQLEQKCNLDIVKQEIKCEDTDKLTFENGLDLETRVNDLSVDTVIKNEVTDEKPKTNSATKVKRETDFPCGLCIEHFKTEPSLFTHLESHKTDSSCKTCQQTFPAWPALLSHRIEHVPRIKQKCHICHRIFRCAVFMEYHYLTKHLDNNLQDIKMTCKYCPKTFSTAIKVKKHMNSVHSNNNYICDHCNKSFRAKKVLVIHMGQHSGVKRYVCDICGYSSVQSVNLKTHIWRNHTATKAYCAHCFRVFPDKATRDKHNCPRTVPYICPVCGKGFKRTDVMKGHMESHAAEALHKCPVPACGAAFRTRANLRAHAARHAGVRPFACPLCPKRFYSSPSLSKHKKVHSGERPYACKICSKRFASSYNMKTHMKVHGEFLVVRRNQRPGEPSPHDVTAVSSSGFYGKAEG